MDWNQILTQIILWVVGAAISAAGTAATVWIKKKITNDKIAKVMNGALQIVADGVNYTYQTFVEELKGTNGWTDAAKNQALEASVDYIRNHLAPEAKTYIQETGQDLTAWAKEQVEIAIKKSKDGQN